MWPDGNDQFFFAVCAAAALVYCHVVAPDMLAAWKKLRNCWHGASGNHTADPKGVEQLMENFRAANLRYGTVVFFHIDLVTSLHFLWTFLHAPTMSGATELAASICASRHFLSTG